MFLDSMYFRIFESWNSWELLPCGAGLRHLFLLIGLCQFFCWSDLTKIIPCLYWINTFQINVLRNHPTDRIHNYYTAMMSYNSGSVHWVKCIPFTSPIAGAQYTVLKRVSLKNEQFLLLLLLCHKKRTIGDPLMSKRPKLRA